MLTEAQKNICKFIMNSDRSTFQVLTIGTQIGHGLHTLADFYREAEFFTDADTIDEILDNNKIACCVEHMALAFLRVADGMDEAQKALSIKTGFASLREALKTVRMEDRR